MRNSDPVIWETSDGLTPYQFAVDRMDDLVGKIINGSEPERIWLVEHPPVFTAGTSAKPDELVTADRFAVYQTGRGGKYTYHGPGQRVAYVMLNLNKREKDVRMFVYTLEQWIINTLAQFNIQGEKRSDRVGVWVRRPDKPATVSGEECEEKIAAIGIRLRKWVSFHGIAINVDPVLEHFSGIIPCGVQNHGVTSLADLGLPVSMFDVDLVLREEFMKLFSDH